MHAFDVAVGADAFVDGEELRMLECRLAKHAQGSVACMWPSEDYVDACWRYASEAGWKDLTWDDACAYAKCRVLSSTTPAKCFAVVCASESQVPYCVYACFALVPGSHILPYIAVYRNIVL